MIKVNDNVEVKLPQGVFVGRVRQVLNVYKNFDGEVRYLVNGKGFETIISERGITVLA